MPVGPNDIVFEKEPFYKRAIDRIDKMLLNDDIRENNTFKKDQPDEYISLTIEGYASPQEIEYLKTVYLNAGWKHVEIINGKETMIPNLILDALGSDKVVSFKFYRHSVPE